MPTYRSINMALHSQFDVLPLPEYRPLPQDHYTSQGVARTVPKYVDDPCSTCSVYIPVLPGSTFWIVYSVSPPVPDGHYFLFKLYINGTHMVSFSTGKEEGWKGKTMFGLYGRPEDEEGKSTVEKRVLRFTPPDEENKVWNEVREQFDEKMCMEIRVHRAHGRKRIQGGVEQYKDTQHAGAVKGIDLVNAGRVGTEQPKRFYKFALTDPVDQPFATFKYYYRTWEQLQDAGVLDGERQGAGPEDDLPVIEPCGSSIRSMDAAETETREQPRAYVPRGAPSAKEASDNRLSVPPSIKFDLPLQSTRRLPTVPRKSSTRHRRHPSYPVDEWRVRTPSPVKSIREGITTPPMEKRKEQRLGATSLMSVLSSKWKRRGASSSEMYSVAGGRSGAQSAT